MSQYDEPNEILNSECSYDTLADYPQGYKFTNIEDTEQLFLDSTYVGKTSHEKSFEILNLSIFNMDSEDKIQTLNDITKLQSKQKPLIKNIHPKVNYVEDEHSRENNQKNHKKIQQSQFIDPYHLLNKPICRSNEFTYGYSGHTQTLQFNNPYKIPILYNSIPIIQPQPKIYQIIPQPSPYNYNNIGIPYQFGYHLGNSGYNVSQTSESYYIIQYVQELYLSGCLIDYLTKSSHCKLFLKKITNMNEEAANYLCDALISIKYGLVTCMLNSNASPTINLMINKLSSDRRLNLLMHIQDKFDILAIDKNGSLSIMCLIQNLNKKKECEFLINLLLKSLKTLSTNENSWTIVVKVIKVFKSEQNKERLNSELISILQSLLSSNQYGVAVVSNNLSLFRLLHSYKKIQILKCLLRLI